MVERNEDEVSDSVLDRVAALILAAESEDPPDEADKTRGAA